jgi:hypothetical protein
MVAEVTGNAEGWKDLLPDEFIPDILELVTTSWDTFNKPRRVELEVAISKEFVKKLRVDKNKSDDLPFHIWPEINTLDNQAENEGRMDILFSYLGTLKEEIHFAFECKRLRIPYPPPGRLVTNNSDYVGEQGMMCFITGKYSRSVTNGGMIAYVMDGKTKEAISSVGKLIKKNTPILKLERNIGLELSSLPVNLRNIRETRHILNTKKFTIHHVFLAV